MRDDLFHVTYFESKEATYTVPSQVSLQELCEQAEYEVAEKKELLKWVKLADFGTHKSDGNSLRNNENVLAVWGCECDYDAGKISFDDAVAALRTAGVECLVCTTPSHKPEAPRWRVFAPCSRKLEPKHRYQLVARINGVLGGVVAPESFVLSQSYYLGHLANGGEFRAEVIEGRHIDLCTELDAGAIGKPGHKPGDGNGAYHHADLEENKRLLLSGMSLHPCAMSIAGTWAKRGDSRAACKEYIRVLIDAANQTRYIGRWDQDIEKGIDWVYDSEEAKSPKPTSPLVLDSIAWDDVPVPERKWTVFNRVPERQVCILSGHGATGKSMLGLHLAAAHAAPVVNEWLKALVEPGPSLFLDAEEDIEEIHRRLAAITDFFECSYEDLIHGGLAVKTLVDDAIMATVDKNGVVVPTVLYKQVLEYAGDLHTKQVIIANSANVFAGNENDRSQVQQFVGLLKRIAFASGGSVVLISHPSLTGLSTNTGISGTTQWHNAVRSRMWLKNVDANGADKQETSDLRLLEFMKNQYGRIEETLTLRYRAGMFLPEPGMSNIEKAARDARSEEAFIALVRRFNAANRPVTDTPAVNYAPKVFAAEKEATDHKLTKAELEGAMRRLFGSNRIRMDEWGPPSKRRRFISENTT